MQLRIRIRPKLEVDAKELLAVARSVVECDRRDKHGPVPKSRERSVACQRRLPARAVEGPPHCSIANGHEAVAVDIDLLASYAERRCAKRDIRERLRNVDGVTRVSLSRSGAEKVDAKADASSDVLELRKSQPCGAGMPPSFEMVVFFEKDAAAVSATPTTANGSVSATPPPTPTATPAAGDGTTSASTTTEQPQGGATP